MAAISGTGITIDFKGARESLQDKIFNVDPQDTPYVSMIGFGQRASAVTEEWQTDTYAAGAANAQLEGDQASYSTPTPTVRVGNIVQISNKTVSISGTQEAVSKAGRKSEMAYQIAKRGVELKLDMEFICLNSQAADAGGASTARQLAALQSWIKANDDFGTSGASPVYTSGVPGATRTDGTQRAFTETIAKAVFELGYTNGAKFSVLMVGPVNKRRVSEDFSGIVTRNFDMTNVDPNPTASIASIDVYVSDFGTVRVIPNRIQRERDAWFINPEFMELRALRPMHTLKLARTGDSEQRLLQVEWTLVSLNEQSQGLAADLTTS